MKGLRVWIAPLVGVVVLGGLVLVLTRGPKPKAPPAATPTPTVWKADPTQVDQIVIAQGGKKLTLTRQAAKKGAAATWLIAGSKKKAWSQKVSGMLALFDPLQATKDLGVVKSPKEYGLTPPAATLQLTLKDGSVRSLQLGSRTPVGGYYATAGNSRVVIVDDSVGQDLVTNVKSWLPPATSTSGA